MSDEWSPDDVQDDAIIGKAFRWSAAALALLLLGIAAVVWGFRRQPAEESATIEKDTSRIESLQVVAEIPRLIFTDITAQAGIDFVRHNGAVGEKLLPETMGGGVAFFDYNNDGHADLFLVNGCDWEATGSDARSATSTCRLYANQGDGTFQDVTATAGLDVVLYGMGCAIGDIDNDGDEDLFVTAVGANRLFLNEAGHFVDVTDERGVAGENIWSTSCGFFDYDRDGDLDLYVANYVDWSPTIDFELNFTLNGIDRAYGPPTNYRGCQPYLYRNDGDHFTEVAEAAGLHVTNPELGTPVAKSLAVILVDVDRDDWPDVVVANDTVQNHFFHNRRDGTFEELGALTGVGFDRNGQATGAMGIDIGCPLADDTAVIGIGNFANEMTSLYVSLGDRMTFADQSLMEGIGAASRARLTFGLLFLDVDLDGRQDMLQTNGHLEEEINQIQPSQTYRQPAQLFWNRGESPDGCFAIVPDEKVGDLARPIVGRGAAYADIDHDGDLDVVLTQAEGPPLLLRNDQASDDHWLRVRLVGTQSNRDAFGRAWKRPLASVGCGGT